MVNCGSQWLPHPTEPDDAGSRFGYLILPFALSGSHASVCYNLQFISTEEKR